MPIRKANATRFSLPFDVLASWLHTLTFIRNCCAHHSRLWPRTLDPTILAKRMGHSERTCRRASA
ncbi:Abi family protein [Pseudomonas silesiensis]|uniref:Abi family protein n=1 Tax=Pseudomonas silesiensis TaxID=1853130 RepID=UPI0030CC48A9